MAKLNFTAADITKMRLSSGLGHLSWSHARLEAVKRKIKDHHLERQEDCCCYCNRNFYGEFRMVIDIEHVIPKSEYLPHIFTQKNLSVACKRCNMNIKKADLGFLTITINLLPNRLFKSKYYRFIHPNLDNYDSHLLLYSVQQGRKKLIKYEVVNESEKGEFTYEYFKLSRLELNSFDLAQDATERVEINEPDIGVQFDHLVNILNR
jgi:hypothetical protein